MSHSTQISLVIPRPLLEKSKEYSKEYGYRNLQELILDLLRRKLVLENAERYKQIELEMRRFGKRRTQREAADYLSGL